MIIKRVVPNSLAPRTGFMEEPETKKPRSRLSVVAMCSDTLWWKKWGLAEKQTFQRKQISRALERAKNWLFEGLQVCQVAIITHCSFQEGKNKSRSEDFTEPFVCWECFPCALAIIIVKNNLLISHWNLEWERQFEVISIFKWGLSELSVAGLGWETLADGCQGLHS